MREIFSTIFPECCVLISKHEIAVIFDNVGVRLSVLWFDKQSAMLINLFIFCQKDKCNVNLSQDFFNLFP